MDASTTPNNTPNSTPNQDDNIEGAKLSAALFGSGARAFGFGIALAASLPGTVSAEEKTEAEQLLTANHIDINKLAACSELSTDDVLESLVKGAKSDHKTTAQWVKESVDEALAVGFDMFDGTVQVPNVEPMDPSEAVKKFGEALDDAFKDLDTP